MLKKVVGKKLKELRLKENITIHDLAAKSRVSSNMISRIERGLTTPSVEILTKLARAFDKSINYFVEEISTTHEIVYSRPGKRDNTVYDDGVNWETECFTSGLRDPQFTSFIVTVKKGSISGEELMFHPGDELIVVLEGRLRVEIAGRDYVLESGDSLSFKAHIPHRWANIGDGDARVIWTMSPFTVI